MDQYQYLDIDNHNLENNRYLSTSIDQLDSYGKDGWRLVWMSPDRLSAILERKIHGNN